MFTRLKIVDCSLLKQDTIINKSWLQYFEIKMNTLTLEYPESLPDSARLSRREFEKSMRFAMAAKLFELGRISSGQAAQQVPMDRFGLGQVKA